MQIYELAALGTALCWALTSLISPMPAQHLGAPAFNRLRQSLVFVVLVAYTLLSGTGSTLRVSDVAPILLSGLFGIFIGDTLLFACMNRLGPRRTSIIFSTSAPFAALLAWLVLGETISARAIFGIVLSFFGVALAIYFGGGKANRLETLRGTLWVGVAIGLGAALCQAIGALLMRPVMKTQVDPFAASMLRVGIGAFALSIFLQLPIKNIKAQNPITRRVFIATAASGVIGLGLGMGLLLFALSGGEVGIVSTLSATTPVMILPLIWWKTGVRPAAGAWAGALIAVAGLALIFSR